VKGVWEWNIFVKGEGVGGNGAGNMQDNEEFIFLPDIGGIELEKVLGFAGDEIYLEGVGSITGGVENNIKLI
jgi:hypothetical protein